METKGVQGQIKASPPPRFFIEQLMNVLDPFETHGWIMAHSKTVQLWQQHGSKLFKLCNRGK